MAGTLTRRQWIAGVAGATAGAGIAASASNVVRRAFTTELDRLTVTRHTVGGIVGATPTSSPVLRVVQLSDMHLERVGSREERVAATVAAIRPGLIVFTGDSVDARARVDTLGDFLSLLAPDARKLAVVGDGEYSGEVSVRALGRAYARGDCELLVNDVADFLVQGRRVLVTGLDDLIGGQPDPARALVGADPTPNHLLLTHCPAQRDRLRWEVVSPVATRRIPDGPRVDLAPYRPRWMLAGHTHGGQIAPFGWGFMRPPGSGRYVSGWYRDAVPELYVSRGIGTSGVPARHRAPPEIAVFEWRLE